MSIKKIITVFGATGTQGGGLVQAILNDPTGEFAVRAITRNAGSDKAKALAGAGAEVVEADIDNAESVRTALQGAYGAYFVTFFWDHFSPEKEFNQARILAEAAKASGLKHVIWSTLEDTRLFVPLSDDSMPTLQGKYKVPHFDAKGEADKHFKEMGVPATFMMISYYWENMIYFGMGPKRGEDGKLNLTFPMGDKKMAGIAAGDIGKCAFGVFKKGTSMVGQTIGIAGEQLTIDEMASKFTKVLGEEVRYNSVSPDAYRSFGFPGAEDLGNMFQFYRDFEDYFADARNVKLSRELNPGLQDFDSWLKVNAGKITLG
jgi:uncharacterized protein YbjT (DUF2867 family)